MAHKLPEQHAFPYDERNRLTRRRSATAEDLEARRQAASPHARTGGAAPSRTTDYPPASPHRAGHFAGIHTEDAPYLFQEVRQEGKKQWAPADYSGGGEGEEQERTLRPPTSVRRYADYPYGQTTTTRLSPNPTRLLQRPRPRFHWLVFVGIGMCIMIAGWLTLGALLSWWQTQQDDWHYGRPRTYQVDAVVGHGDSASHPSHFIAMNLNRHVLVIEIPGGDPARALVYLGPTLLGDGQDLTPVTLNFQDMNGDGKPDMVIQIGDQEIVFLNNGTKFVSPH